MDVDQADVAFSALDAADVRTVEIAPERERLLRKPFLFSEFSHTFTETLLTVRGTSLHPVAIESPKMTMSPRTLRIVGKPSNRRGPTVAPWQFTEEHRATLDWLNEITDEKFNFFGVEV